MMTSELLDKINAIFYDNKLLIGDYEFQQSDLDEMKGYCQRRFASIPGLSSLAEHDIAIFSVYVINRLRMWEKDWSGRMFWNRIGEMFDNDPNIAKFLGKHNFSELINNTFEKANRQIFQTANKSKRQFAETLLYHAYAPKESLYAFIQLAWSIYIDPELLDSYYGESNLDFCKSVIRNLKSKYSSEDTEQEIQFCGATYNIRVGLRYGVFQDESRMQNILDKIFKYIYRVDYKHEDVDDDHLGVLVTDKVTELKHIRPRDKKSGERRSLIRGFVDSFNKLNPQYKFDIEHRRVLICLPKYTSDQYVPKSESAILRIYSGNLLKETLFLRWKKRESFYILNSVEKDITNYVVDAQQIDLSIEIEVDGENYTWNLSREYLLFKDNSEANGNRRAGNYYLVVPATFNFEKLKTQNQDTCNCIQSGIYVLEASDGDSIVGKSQSVYFGTIKEDRIQFSKPEAIDKLLTIIRRGQEVPVFLSVSDILISLRKTESGNNVNLLHIYQPFDESAQRREYRITDLSTEGQRSVFFENQGLSLSGYHEIQLFKNDANGAIGLLKVPIRYYIDKKLKAIFNNKTTYEDGVFNIEIPFLEKLIGSSTTEVSLDKDYSVIPINDDESIHVTFPYFKWGMDSDAFYSTQLKTPIFSRDLSQNQLIFVDTPFAQVDIFIKNNSSQSVLLRKVQNNTFALGEVLDEKDGTIVAHIGDLNRDITLFTITTNPYITERSLNTIFNLRDNGTCTMDFSKCFKHDNLLEYRLSICLISENNDEIVFENLASDDINEVKDERLIDGTYELAIFWQSVSGGIVGEKCRLSLQHTEIQLGEPLKAYFNSLKFLNLDYFRYESKDGKTEKQRLKGCQIVNLRYKETTENGYIFYSGILRCPEFKKGLVISFIIYEKNAIGQFYFNGPNNEIKFLNYNILQKRFTLDECVANKICTLKRVITSK